MLIFKFKQKKPDGGDWFFSEVTRSKYNHAMNYFKSAQSRYRGVCMFAHEVNPYVMLDVLYWDRNRTVTMPGWMEIGPNHLFAYKRFFSENSTD